MRRLSDRVMVQGAEIVTLKAMMIGLGRSLKVAIVTRPAASPMSRAKTSAQVGATTALAAIEMARKIGKWTSGKAVDATLVKNKHLAVFARAGVIEGDVVLSGPAVVAGGTWIEVVKRRKAVVATTANLRPVKQVTLTPNGPKRHQTSSFATRDRVAQLSGVTTETIRGRINGFRSKKGTIGGKTSYIKEA
ncbi:hypothetical protein HOY82DRAFT_604082 [Tuber indicum]|nr:hypothetical protein HOY82DRAFT_604082 [Tuber indicum]